MGTEFSGKSVDDKRNALGASLGFDGDVEHWRGLYMPANEAHLKKYFARTGYHERAGLLTYQYKKYKACLGHMKGFRNAIDVGGFIGQWSHVMAQDFAHVYAFEPVPLYRHCWHLNNYDNKNAYCHAVAVGCERKRVSYENRTRYSHGDTAVVPGDDVDMVTLDSLHFTEVDFLKIDVEGFEVEVLIGAWGLIDKYKPVIIVEQKAKYYEPDDYTPAEWLEEEFDYSVAEIISGDAIMVP